MVVVDVHGEDEFDDLYLSYACPIHLFGSYTVGVGKWRISFLFTCAARGNASN
jgi:hypothetical protein